jgi:hypothetical protein
LLFDIGRSHSSSGERENFISARYFTGYGGLLA